MKKFNLVAIATLAILSSCSNDDTMLVTNNSAQQSSPIAFSNAFVNKSTRATEVTTTESLDNFAVWGYAEDDQVFNGELISKSGNDWTYNSIKYWVPGRDYTFTAIAPSNGKKWEYTPTDTKGGTISITNDGEQDMVYAYQTSAATENASRGQVKFTFNHLLTRAKFQFTNGEDKADVSYTIKNIKITNADQTASVAVSEGTAGDWDITADDVITLNYGETQALNPDDTEATDYKYLIPYASEHQYLVDFDIVVTQDNISTTYEHRDIKTESIELKPGKSYVFAITLNSSNIDPSGASTAIEFNAQVTEWDAETSKNALGNTESKTTDVNPYADVKMYMVYNPGNIGNGTSNSAEMTDNGDGSYSITYTTASNSFIISSTADKDFFFGKADLSSQVLAKPGTYTLAKYSYKDIYINGDQYWSNYNYQSYVIDLDQNYLTNMKFTFYPNEAKLIVEQVQ